ncbi:MAG: DUF5658 family protein [Acidobacteria bacterium]|nr:DUF5658 family protein [Acidobacteriota bacterium]MCA1642552.1 DUF5658 family protein [Acidobacteriota bacterium]
MSALTKSLLLFALNLLDAQLTIIWVRSGVATEGNGLMARVLEAGNAPFFLTKFVIGAAVAYLLYRFSALAVARRGMRFVLGLYLALMLVHAATGLSAVHMIGSGALVAYVARLPQALLAILS